MAVGGGWWLVARLALPAVCSHGDCIPALSMPQTRTATGKGNPTV